MTRMQTHSLRAAAVVTLLHVTLWCGATTHAAVDLTVENVEAAAGSEVEVPISVRGASGLEGIQFVLTFDPESLEFLDVTPAPLAGAADIHLVVVVLVIPVPGFLPVDLGQRGQVVLGPRRRVCPAAVPCDPANDSQKGQEFRSEHCLSVVCVQIC